MMRGRRRAELTDDQLLLPASKLPNMTFSERERRERLMRARHNSPLTAAERLSNADRQLRVIRGELEAVEREIASRERAIARLRR